MFTPKRLSALCLFSVMMLFSASSMASIFSYITESKVLTPSSANYTFIIQRWDPETTMTLNPCYGGASCKITINHRHNASGQGGAATRTVLTGAQKYRTMAELRDAVMRVQSFPTLPTVAHHSGVPNSEIQECVGLFYETGTTKLLLPGSMCGIAPPPAGACEIIDGSVNLNYGDIDEDKLGDSTQNKRSQTIRVTCNKDLSVVVYASSLDGPNVRLRPDGSLFADLYLNNRPGENGETIFVPAGRATPVVVSSILRPYGRVAPGSFSGVGTLILAMP